jgi:hypothetical protein
VYDDFRRGMNASEDVRVLTYYGIGGIGKTSLLKQLASEMKERVGRPLFVYHDFNVRRDVRGVLEGMRNQLSREQKFTFPVFDIAMYVYAKKVGEHVNENCAGGLIEKSPVLSLAFSVLGMMPTVGVVSRLVALADKGGGVVKNILSKRGRELSEIDAESVESIYRRLPYYFARDLADNLRDSHEPLVVFFDTYEMLVNEISASGDPMNDDMWIRGNEGLAQNVPKVLWVIAGREKIKWALFNPDWENSLEQHLLGSLSERDAKFFLESAGVRDEKLIDYIYRLTDGTPVFIDLCVDNYYSLKDGGREPDVGDFGGDISLLAERYVRYLDDGKKDIVYLLSCLKSWDDEIFFQIAGSVIPNYSATTYEKIKGQSFVESNGEGVWRIQNTVLRILRRMCPKFIKEKTQAAMTRFCREKLDSIPVAGIEFAPVFSLYLDYALQSIRTEKSLTEFYGTIAPKLRDIGVSCQFDFLCEKMAPLRDFAEKLSPQSETGALMGADYSKFLMDAGKYRQALEQARASYDVFNRFYGEAHELTIDSANLVSQSLSLLGKDEEALALMEKNCRLAEEHLGGEHPLTADCMNRMANRLFALGEYGRALEFNEKTLSVRRKIFGEDSPEALNALESMTMIYSGLGRDEEAATVNETVLRKRREILGDRHPHTLNAMNNLAYRYVRLKRPEAALPLAQAAVNAQTEIYGEEHVNLVPSLGTLSECHTGLGEHEKAISIQKSVYKICVQALGERHKKTAQALKDLADRYRAAGDMENFAKTRDAAKRLNEAREQ